ncbi:universal stress protein [Rhodobacteraceae bacterium 2376]|uniref:Universal stress protein n=1 Tax=Rhabdonatronobacter sediminivivens TaxID=2743469 RepID=A0A7Z0HZX7_9RHOB|nr:universal stress protein [Rhabdonatronobacter sediminivivens]NYS25300.1 universal stress protein [Rhabdonatronobacter sediminivivens]
MYKNILIPLAYEPGHPAKAEIAAARSLAAPGAKLTLLHIMDPVPKFAAAHLPDSARAEMRNTIEHDLQRHADTLLGAEIRIIDGEPGRQIIAQATELGADCIVMASHRTHKGEYGSTTARVVRHAPCTVHLLR